MWGESDELKRFIAGYLALLPVRRTPTVINNQFVDCWLELTDGLTCRVADVVRRAAGQNLLCCTTRDQRAPLNAFSALANQLRIFIVFAGAHESIHVMRYDHQNRVGPSKSNFQSGMNPTTSSGSSPDIAGCCPSGALPRRSAGSSPSIFSS